MALRVLLADESTTIKKVMQLALQDFAVEVKSVHAGVDVLDVARSYQPDLIFADVLLQKKNGYEVCAMLKADSGLKAIPVVLMWSSFMDLDDQAARNAGAEGRLEKPFDVETLRKIVLELVPKTRSQRLAHFLEFPVKANAELREEEEAKHQDVAPTPPAPAKATPPPLPPPPVQAQPSATINLGPAPTIEMPPPPSSAASWSMESFDDPAGFEEEAFQPLELSQMSSNEPPAMEDFSPAEFSTENSEAPSAAADDEVWTHQDLSRFKLDLPSVTVDSGDGDFKIDMGENEFTSSRADQMFQAATPPPIAEPNPFYQRAEQTPNPFGDLQSDLHVEFGGAEEIALPESSEPTFGLEVETDDDELTLENSTLDTGKIPQVSADRLEEIIRAQSRDIIESVVRKIVPDLAAAIIREELERLLEDTRP